MQAPVQGFTKFEVVGVSPTPVSTQGTKTVVTKTPASREPVMFGEKEAIPRQLVGPFVDSDIKPNAEWMPERLVYETSQEPTKQSILSNKKVLGGAGIVALIILILIFK